MGLLISLSGKNWEIVSWLGFGRIIFFLLNLRVRLWVDLGVDLGLVLGLGLDLGLGVGFWFSFSFRYYFPVPLGQSPSETKSFWE